MQDMFVNMASPTSAMERTIGFVSDRLLAEVEVQADDREFLRMISDALHRMHLNGMNLSDDALHEMKRLVKKKCSVDPSWQAQLTDALASAYNSLRF